MKYGGYTGISVSICMFVDDFLSVHPELMKIQLYFDLPILEELCLFSYTQWESVSNRSVSVIVIFVVVNFFTLSTSLNPLHGFASTFMWIFCI